MNGTVMGRKTFRELRAAGVSEDDIETARITQHAQRRNGYPVQSVGVIVGVTKPRTASTIDLTAKALRRRGSYDQAALLLDQQALHESTPERAIKAREAAMAAKELSSTVQLEFNFFGGNVSLAHDYMGAIHGRLRQAAPTPAKRGQAIEVLWVMIQHMAWEDHEVKKTAAELAELTGIKPSNLSVTIRLLEDVGAIRRVRKGRQNIITITPEGVYRGNVNNHVQAVERYKMEVIDGGKK